jgi:hypothetical protein
LCAKDSEIGGRVAAHNDRRDTATVYKRHARLVDALHDVLVRQHIAVRCHNDAGAGTTAALARRVARGRIATNVNTHDRRTDELDRANDRRRVGVEGVVGRRLTQRAVYRRSFFQHWAGMGTGHGKLKSTVSCQNRATDPTLVPSP